MALTPQSLQFIYGATSSSNLAWSITSDPSGNVYVCGYTDSGAAGPFTFAGAVFQKPTTSGNAMFIGKIDANGVPQWLVMLDGLGNELIKGSSCLSYNNGNVYVAGSTDITGAGALLTFITCGTPAGAPIVSTPYFKDVTSGISMVILKLNTTFGALQWLRILDGALDEEPFSIKAASATNELFFTGYTSTTTNTPLKYISCGTSAATSVYFAKPVTTAQSILIGDIDCVSGNCYWIVLIDGLTAGATEQGNSIDFDDIGDNLLITGATSSTGTSLNYIQCTQYTLPGPIPPSPIPVLYTKATTIGEALFILNLGSSGVFTWMRILDGANFQRGMGVTISIPEVYVIGTATLSTPYTMQYSEVVPSPASVPTPVTWNVPTVPLITTSIAKIDIQTGNLQLLKFLYDASATVIPTSIALSPNTSNLYISGSSTSSGGSIKFQTASTTLPLPTLETYPIPSLNTQNGFILKLDDSLNYLESNWIDRANALPPVGNYSLLSITVDNQDNIYVVGTTNDIPAGTVNFGGQVFTKPLTTTLSSFVGRLKNVTVNPICYAKGTLIATDRGFVPIEDIKLSDKVRTFGCIKENIFEPVHGVPVKTLTRVEDTRIKNRFASIKFIGHFSVNGMYSNSAPICITAGALGENKPERDLFVSPNHAILIGDRLVFAKDLINEITIYQDMSFENIEYYHILCDNHYIINANGTLSETLGTEELKLFESMIYAQSKVYEPLSLENKYHLQDVAI